MKLSLFIRHQAMSRNAECITISSGSLLDVNSRDGNVSKDLFDISGSIWLRVSVLWMLFQARASFKHSATSFRYLINRPAASTGMYERKIKLRAGWMREKSSPVWGKEEAAEYFRRHFIQTDLCAHCYHHPFLSFLLLFSLPCTET